MQYELTLHIEDFDTGTYELTERIEAKTDGEAEEKAESVALQMMENDKGIREITTSCDGLRQSWLTRHAAQDDVSITVF